jgi:hypothetical protein
MKRLLTVVSFFAAFAAALSAAPLPVTPYTVIAKVKSFEHYRVLGSDQRFGPDTPYGNDYTIVATILAPASLAGRELAIPFESKKVGKELLVQPGTVFRFEHAMNLTDLRYKTDDVKRRAIGFPELGILALNAEGEVTETYDGHLTALKAAELAKQASATR